VIAFNGFGHTPAGYFGTFKNKKQSQIRTFTDKRDRHAKSTVGPILIVI
jgi:hypothetical protein